MKTSLRTLLLPILACFFTGTMVLPASAQEQPHMSAALELLHRAQDAHEPIPLLRAARKELEQATNDKGGLRVEAIKIIKHAIDEGETGRKVKMEEHVAAAIVAVHDAMAAAR